MKSPCIALIGLLALSQGVRAEEGQPATALQPIPSDRYPEVTCMTSNPAVCVDVLQLAADTRDQLEPLLRLGRTWRFPVHIHIVTPDDPLAGKVHSESASVIATGQTMEITAVLPSTDLDAREFIQRQFVTALLWEKFFASTQTFDTHTRLDVVPLWLTEGLREWLNDDVEHQRENIVKRATATHRAPTLYEVLHWQQLSNDRLMGLWQCAFSYYLVNSLLRTSTQRDDFQQWLTATSGPNPASAKLLFPTEMGWQRELVDATQRSNDIVYSWDETVVLLATAETITIPPDKGKAITDTHICTFDSVTTFPRDDKLIAVLKQKIFDLTNLELRAHLSWRPIIALYRFGLTALVDNKTPDVAQKFIVQARQQSTAEMAYHQKILDYVNWFEVTKDYASASTHFRTYFSTAQEMEQVQADPKHPNPIRANLLQIESQL